MVSAVEDDATLEWFGGTTFRLRSRGITLLLDAFLDRPPHLKSYLRTDDVTECDYIFISHAHFDQLPGADRIAKQTGATIIANGEAISLMRKADVPENQLIVVAGGERIPLFTRSQCEEAARNAPPSSPPIPDASIAPISVHVWPSQHCFVPPGDPMDFPDILDTSIEYTGETSHQSSLDLTNAIKYQLLSLTKLPQDSLSQLPADLRDLISYLQDEKNFYSVYDGGQMAYNFLLGPQRTLLWSSQLGAYDGVLRNMEPKPNIAILGIAGRANLNGRPFDGSAAQFVTKKLKWLGEPEGVIWCLHDEAPLKPKKVDVRPATEMVEKETRCRVMDLKHGEVYRPFEMLLSRER